MKEAKRLHELAVTRSLLQILLQKVEDEHLQKVTRVFLVVGAMQNYEEVWMQRYFDKLSTGTPLEGAVIEVKRIPLRFCCRSCGETFSLDIKSDAPLVCPQCGSEQYDRISGQEFYIDRIEAVGE